MSAATVGDLSGGDRRSRELHDENARLRAELFETRERLSRLSREADAARGVGRGVLPTVRATAPERETPRTLADRLRADAEAAARLLAENDARVRALETELERQRTSTGSLAERDELRRSRAQILDLRAQRDRALAEVDAMAGQLATLRAELNRLTAAAATKPPDRLPVLARDLARWSTPEPAPQAPQPAVVAVTVAVAVGPPPLPPSLDDLEAVDHHIATIRRLIQTPAVAGQPFHTLFDDPRYQALHAKLREAGLLAERFLSQVERSRANKELLWHLMVARKNDEIHRKRR